MQTQAETAGRQEGTDGASQALNREEEGLALVVAVTCWLALLKSLVVIVMVMLCAFLLERSWSCVGRMGCFPGIHRLLI